MFRLSILTSIQQGAEGVITGAGWPNTTRIPEQSPFHVFSIGSNGPNGPAWTTRFHKVQTGPKLLKSRGFEHTLDDYLQDL